MFAFITSFLVNDCISLCNKFLVAAGDWCVTPNKLSCLEFREFFENCKMSSHCQALWVCAMFDDLEPISTPHSCKKRLLCSSWIECELSKHLQFLVGVILHLFILFINLLVSSGLICIICAKVMPRPTHIVLLINSMQKAES